MIEKIFGDDELHETVDRGRRATRWRTKRSLENDLTEYFMAKITEEVNTSFYARHIFARLLRNIEAGTVIEYYTNIGSPWFNRHSEAEEWLRERERVHQDSDKIERPSTKW